VFVAGGDEPCGDGGGVCGGAVRRGGRGGGGLTRASPGGVDFDSFLPLLFRQSSQAVEASSSTVPSTA
jgi:hypothetical protein